MNNKGINITDLTGLAALLTMFIALLLVFAYAPMEKTMGMAQKIFYFHVPSAFMSFLSFAIVFVASILYLKSDLFHILIIEITIRNVERFERYSGHRFKICVTYIRCGIRLLPSLLCFLKQFRFMITHVYISKSLWQFLNQRFP